MPKAHTTTNVTLPKSGLHTLKITSFTEPGKHRTGRLRNVSDKDIHLRIPEAHFSDTPSSDGKVTLEWSFKADGHHCGIWDYRGARFSTYGPNYIFKALFGESYEND